MAPILEQGKVIGGRYEVVEQLKHYKELFKCKDLNNSNEELIIKVEIIDEIHLQTNRLQTEWQLYRRLSTTKCFDFVIDYLSDDRFHYLVMRPLGPNLYDFMKLKKRQNEWNLETVVKYADEMISRVANSHIRGIIHRDIKPENFVVDNKDNNYLYLIDFNLGTQFSTPTIPHIPYHIRSPKHSVGNVQFLSANSHKGEEQSRRDDLISVCYTLIYLAKGSLPWSNIRSAKFSSRFEYLKAVGHKKYNCSVDELCDGLPVQFKNVVNYCLNLEFEENPDYLQLRGIFRRLLSEMKSSNVTLVHYKPKPESESIPVTPLHIKRRIKLSERFKKCLTSSSPTKCP